MSEYDWIPIHLLLPPEVVLEEMEEEGEGELTVRCPVCTREVDGVYACDAEEAVPYRCPVCVLKLLPEVIAEAQEFARVHCQITRPTPQYDPELEIKCTPEEYAAGNRESYSRKAFRNALRHEYTNYDDLLKSLDRNDWVDWVYYRVIRLRVAELLGYDEAEDPDLDDQFDVPFST